MPLVSKAFGDIITFTRASTATYFDSAGVLQSAAINVPRFDYDPSTLAAQGLLIEEQRTNLLTYSAQYDNAAWTKETSVSVSANTTVAPDGTTTGDTVTADQDRAIYQSVAATIGITYCQSVFIKAGTATSILFRDDTGAGRNITINPSTGAITATGGTLVTSGSQAIGNGWWRYWFAYVADTATVRGLLRPNTAGAAQTFIVWGAQTEAGAFPTSYIPTTTTALTRSADVAVVNTLSPWFNASEGTLFAQAEVPSAQLITRTMAQIGRSTDVAQDINVQISRAADGRRVVSIINSTSQFSYIPTGNVTSSKGSVAYKENDSQGAFEGTAGPVDTSVTLPTLLTTLYLGNGDSGTVNLNGWLQRVTYYPRRLSEAELISITA